MTVFECRVRGCDYQAETTDQLAGHVRGKSPHDDRHADALEMGALDEWTADDRDPGERPGPNGETGHLGHVPADDELELAEPTGATDAEVAEAVAEVEDAGDYDALWTQEATDGTEGAASTEPVDEGLPTTWLVVGTVVLLVVLVLVVSNTGGATETIEAGQEEEEDGPIDPASIEVIGGEL